MIGQPRSVLFDNMDSSRLSKYLHTMMGQPRALGNTVSAILETSQDYQCDTGDVTGLSVQETPFGVQKTLHRMRRLSVYCCIYRVTAECSAGERYRNNAGVGGK